MNKNTIEGDTVAFFVNKKGRTVFYVTAARDGYITTHLIEGIKSHFISYSDAKKMCLKEEASQIDSGDILFSVCEKFEENYYEQVNHLLEQF